MHKPRIGFVGQGYVGKNYADDFEARGYSVVRYALEEPYAGNKDKIKDCEIVFIAVPTPTTPAGFDDSIVRGAIALVGPGKTAVIKSTVLPGTTAKLQEEYPDRIVLFSPEFLSEATAAEDAAHPKRTIVGMGAETPEHKAAAERVLAALPKAPYERVCRAVEAEFVKYGGNCWFYTKVIFINLLYDLVRKEGADYDVVREAMAADPRIGASHLVPVHKSGTAGSDNYHLLEGKDAGGARGAGGHCFIKDFAAFSRLYRETFPEDASGSAVLDALEQKNLELLRETGKDLDLVRGVYGADALR